MSKSGVTEAGAKAKLRSFFQGVDGDFVPTSRVFENEKRDPELPKNKNWYYNYAYILKKYGLVNPLKGPKNGNTVTLGLTLTDKGRAALGDKSIESTKAKNETQVSRTEAEVSLATWRDDGYKLRSMHPELVIDFDIRMRREDE